ncbi:hypothetical protein BH09BAC6_BH09BAC6_09760 [soil metagenome]
MLIVSAREIAFKIFGNWRVNAKGAMAIATIAMGFKPIAMEKPMENLRTISLIVSAQVCAI